MSGPVELHPLVQFVFQLGVLIVLTRVGGYWLRRWLRLPGVLGELIVGMLIGPYALGRFAWLGLQTTARGLHRLCHSPTGHLLHAARYPVAASMGAQRRHMEANLLHREGPKPGLYDP